MNIFAVVKEDCIDEYNKLTLILKPLYYFVDLIWYVKTSELVELSEV